MLSRSNVIAALIAGVFLALSTNSAQADSRAADGCTLGAYRSPGGDLVAVTRAYPGKTIERFTSLEGRRGNADDPDSPVRCENGQYTGRDASGKTFTWERLNFRATPTTFKSKGTDLHGLLLEPTTGAKKPPLVIFVHGSERQSPLELYYQELYTAQGVSTFFYDKRGTGESKGSYTQDFMLLAEDAANAARAARKLAAGRFSRLGFYGGSQGGWIAPVAALKVHADFLEVAFGCVCTALEQDQWQVDYQLIHEDGFDSKILPDVHQITQVTADIMGSDSPKFDELAKLKAANSGQPWFAKIDGQYSGEFLRGNPSDVWRESHSLDVPWHYLGLTTLRQLTIPQLWVFAQDDSVAPSAGSIRRLQTLSSSAHLRSIVVFPQTDHGILTFHVGSNGERISDGNAANGYLRLLSDFAKGTLSGSYGDATWLNKGLTP